MPRIRRIWQSTPLAFDLGVLVGVAMATVVYTAVIFAWGVWIVRNTYG